jgi:MATE family multidrug resistance protein
MAEPMTNKKHITAILTLGLPLIGSHLGQMAIHMTDTVMIGWYGVEELAALVLASSLFFLFFLVGAGFSFAVMPMVASAASAGDDIQVRRVTRMGMWASTIYVILAMPFLWWSKALLIALGQDESVAGLAQDYLRIAGFGLWPALLVMVIKSYLAAMEYTQVVFWGTVLGAIFNALMNYALIFGNWGASELGIEGAAISSLLMASLSFPILAVYAVMLLPEHALFQRIWRSDIQALVQVFRLGWPIGLTNLAETALFMASAIMMGWIGTVELAAHGIAIQWASITFMVHVGLSNAATVRAGRAIGRVDEEGLRKGGVIVTVMSLFFAGLIVIVFLLMPETLISVFLDKLEPARDQIMVVGISLLAMAAFFQVADGAQVIALGLLRGVQDTRVPMIMAGISYWIIGLPAGYLLGFTWGFGAVGIWMGLVFGLVVASVLLSYRFWKQTGFIKAKV